jgi:hypothetical protein
MATHDLLAMTWFLAMSALEAVRQRVTAKDDNRAFTFEAFLSIDIKS